MAFFDRMGLEKRIYFLYLRVKIVTTNHLFMEQSDNMVSNFIEKFSPHLFWDTDRSKLDWTKHRSYIVERVLEYGLFSDWQLLRSRLSVTEIAKLAKQFRQLDTKTLAFISAISNTPKEEFRCYNTKQSNQPHWNF